MRIWLKLELGQVRGGMNGSQSGAASSRPARGWEEGAPHLHLLHAEHHRNGNGNGVAGGERQQALGSHDVLRELDVAVGAGRAIYR